MAFLALCLVALVRGFTIVAPYLRGLGTPRVFFNFLSAAVRMHCEALCAL